MTTQTLRCPKCGSPNTNVQIVTTQRIRRKYRNIIMWILFWWWIELALWIFAFPLRFLMMLFRGKRYRITTRSTKHGVCQTCASSWRLS